jgi:NADPH-dependent glutamate synthase beta subunit-like oxidoreductase
MVEGRTHRPIVQHEKCHSCDVCIRGCPAELIPEYRQEETSLRSAVYRRRPGEVTLRESDTLPLPPCQEACPIRQDARGYISLVAKGKLKEALDLIREVNPLPSVCGFICHHPCEETCLRAEVDQPVPIRLLKRFVAEYGRRRGGSRKTIPKERREKVLVVGSGPAGLTAANDLRLLGYQVTLVEALPVLGGMLAVGIPEFRLPRDILNFEIDSIRRLGVEMLTKHRFRFDGDYTGFRTLGYRAVFLAPGAHRSLRLNIPGEKLHGVHPGVEFLRDLNLGKNVRMGKKIAVIGGGNVALDVARSAIRLGSVSVEIFYRRSRQEMPAIPEEVEEAIREGIKIHFLASPVKILAKASRASAIECVKMRLAGRDETGRRRPVPVDGSNFKVQADTIIAAIGQRVDRTALKKLDVNPDGTVQVDSETGATSLEGVFAGGDVVTGPGWAIDAIAAGKKAATSIHQYLS